MDTNLVKAETGRPRGTRPSRRLRRDGRVPAVVYGMGQEPVTVSVDKTDLRGALMIGADLQESDLSGADLRGLDLGGISLRGADLSNAKLNGANLRGVNLTEAKLDGADLSSAKWVFAPAICVEGSLGDYQY